MDVEHLILHRAIYADYLDYFYVVDILYCISLLHCCIYVRVLTLSYYTISDLNLWMLHNYLHSIPNMRIPAFTSHDYQPERAHLVLFLDRKTMTLKYQYFTRANKSRITANLEQENPMYKETLARF